MWWCVVLLFVSVSVRWSASRYCRVTVGLCGCDFHRAAVWRRLLPLALAASSHHWRSAIRVAWLPHYPLPSHGRYQPAALTATAQPDSTDSSRHSSVAHSAHCIQLVRLLRDWTACCPHIQPLLPPHPPLPPAFHPTESGQPLWALIAQAVGVQPAVAHLLLTAAACHHHYQQQQQQFSSHGSDGSQIGDRGEQSVTVSRMDRLLAMSVDSIQHALPPQHKERAVTSTHAHKHKYSSRNPRHASAQPTTAHSLSLPLNNTTHSLTHSLTPLCYSHSLALRLSPRWLLCCAVLCCTVLCCAALLCCGVVALLRVCVHCSLSFTRCSI